MKKDLIVQLFHDTIECYGYKRIKASFSSYKGGINPESKNN